MTTFPGNRHEDSSVTLDEVLAVCERSIERHDPTVEQSLTLRYPQYSDEIQVFFRCQGVIERVAEPVFAALSGVRPPPSLSEYESLVEVGRGGMGVVYKGRHRATGRMDAVKFIHPDRVSSLSKMDGEGLVARFRRECLMAAQVAHQNIVPVYHVGECEQGVYYSMRFVDGPTLHDLMTDPSLSPQQSARYIEQVARAIEALHQHGILHGDIKPHNIVVDSETEIPLIGDFGLAAMESSGCLDTSSEFMGTPGYLPPEVVQSLREDAPGNVNAVLGATISADVYGLGSTLYALLTGGPPHPGETAQARLASTLARDVVSVRTHNPKIPRLLAEICQKALARDPRHRFSTAAELADALEIWLNQPDWSRHFPKLGHVLFAVAPLLLLSNMAVYFMLRSAYWQSLVWMPVFASYIPLFVGFSLSGHAFTPAGRPALRALWSTWIGHFAASASSYISLRLLLAPDQHLVMAAFYACFAAISALTFFVNSAHFWVSYRWIGFGWMWIAVGVSVVPDGAPLIIGIGSSLTACVIAIQERRAQTISSSLRYPESSLDCLSR